MTIPLYRMIRSGDDVAGFTDWLGEQPFVAVDTETTGLDYYGPDFRVRLIQFGNTETAWLARLDQWEGLAEWVFEKLVETKRRIVIHNAAFDLPSLGTHKIRIPWGAVDDTMIALRILAPNQSAALKASSRRLLGSDGGGEAVLKKAMLKQRWDWRDIPIDFEPYLRYAALDVVLVSRIFMLPEVQEILRSPSYALEMDVRALCSRMEANGMRIDREFAKEKFAELRHESDDLKERYRGIVNLTSPEELGRWFISNTDRSLIDKRTERGRISVDKPVLDRIVARGDRDSANVARSVLRVRKVEKLAASYFSNFLTYNRDGILHPSIDTVAARTGRMSIRNPALQTLPKPNSDPESRIVRQAIIPLREGEVLLSVDSAQIELRIAASLAGDASLVSAFEDDFFLKTARDIFDDPDMTKHDDRRQVVKTAWYSILYGAGNETMAVRAGVTTDRMAEIRTLMHTTYPGFFRFQKVIEREARLSGGVKTFGGRFLPVDASTLYAAVNYAIQGSAGEFLKRSLLAMGNAGLEDFLLVPVHDEVVLSLPPEHVEEVSRILLASMTHLDLMVPLTASINGPGANWAEL